MPEERYDCIVIGSGPGGYVAAIRAAQLGMKTAVVEKGNTGGRCLNEACIPAKAILRVAEVFTEVEHAGSFGIKVDGATVDYGGAAKHRDKVIKTLTGGVAGLFKKNEIDLIEGFGSVTDDGNVKIGGQFDGTEIKADRVVLACGSIAKPILDLQFGKRILDTAGMWLLNEQPERLCVIGAGASGTEIASALGRLGTEVLLLEALDQILPLEEPEIAKACAREMAKQNVRIETGAKVESVEASDSSVSVTFNGETEEFDYLVIAAGRGPDVEGLGLEEAGIERDERGLIKVDGRLRTSREGVWAIGDMVPGPALAHKASDEGIIAVEDATGHGRAPDRLRLRARRDLLPPAGGLLRPHRGRGQGGRPRGGGRQGPDGRRRRAHRLRRPRRDGQDRGRRQVRRAARCLDRLGQGRRPDPGARERPRARGRVSRGRAHHPRPSVVRRGRDGGGPGDGWVAHPRLSSG